MIRTPKNINNLAIQIALNLTIYQRYYLSGPHVGCSPLFITTPAYQALEDLCYLGLMDRDFDGHTLTYLGAHVAAFLRRGTVPAINNQPTIVKGKPIWIRRSNRWGVKVTFGTPIRGGKVLVTTREGKTFEKLISQIVWKGWSNFDRKYISICETVNVPKSIQHPRCQTSSETSYDFDASNEWVPYDDFDGHEQDQGCSWDRF